MTLIKQLAMTCLLSMMAFVSANAQWIDVTNAFIKNPNYDGCDFSYWEGTGLSQAGGKDNAEHFQKNYDTYQNLTGLTPGCRYRISLNAYYRYGNAGDDYNAYTSGHAEDYQHARLYAQVEEDYFDTGIVLCSSAALNESLGGSVSWVNEWRSCIPNNMEAAHYWFEAGYYINTLEFTAGVNGSARIGIKKDYMVGGDWTCIDTWRLEMESSKVVSLKSINFTNKNITIAPGDKAQLEVKYTPSNATVKTCTFRSSDETIARVGADGIVTAYSTGTATIYATTYNNLTSTCQVKVENVPYVEGGLVINEIQASNVDCVMDPSFNYGSWIELYNPTDKACGLAGLYITDDPADLKKHPLSMYIGSVPAHGYKNIWFDHYGIWNMGELTQVNFKLDYDGGTIIISDGDRILVQQDYPQAIGRTSYARKTDGGAEWAVSATPSPEASNTGMTFASEQLAAPVVDTDGRLFSGSLTVKVTIPSGTQLYYTTDGSTPTKENATRSLTGRFTVKSSTAYRFRLFKDGYIPSEIVTRTYIQDDSNLDVIAMTTDNENLYNNETGLFECGPNGRAGNGRDDRCNWNMDWDRPANFEFITTDGEYALSQEVDMSMCGGWSRAWTPHSFKIKAAKYYMGQNYFDYQFFPDKPFLKHRTLQIRNGGNNGLLKDASLQEIMRRSGLYIETQSWRPVNVYINGQFYAQLNMREPNNKHYGYANYGIDTDEMDQFEMSPDSGYVQMTGTREAFERLYELSFNATDTDTYKEIGKLLDIDEFINYYAAEVFLGGNDWLRNNVKAFRDRNDGKFRFVVFDTDAAFSGNTLNSYKNMQYWGFDGLRGEDAFGNKLSGNMYKEIEIITIFGNLVQNETFRRKFVDALCVIGGSTFHPDFAEPIINEMASKMNVWRDNPINNLRDRQPHVAQQLTSGAYDFGVSNNQAFTATLGNSVDNAVIYVNDMPVPTGKFSGTLYQPVTLKAIAPAGYEFKGWRLDNGLLDNNYETKTVFDKGTVWSYYDGTNDLYGENWKSADYVSAWPQGKAPIGYDKDDNPKGLNTWVSHKVLPTYYVSKNFSLDSKTANDRFILDFRVDDGMVIYINGKEAARHNMPSGEIYYNTYSNTWADNQCDYGEIVLPNGLFRIGENTIAVEVHNNDNKSSDIHWDAALSHLIAKEQGDVKYVSTDAKYTLPKGSDISLIADYEPIAEDNYNEENGIYPVRINEVSAGNTIYVNDLFKKDDWIELYNPTSNAIDVAGMYISDNENKPQKFQIPDDDQFETVIEPFGHLVIWASKRNAIGSQIHASFKLANNDGEKVILTSEDGTWSDKLIYNAHNGDETVGRYPDGSNDVYKMQRPTISKANELTSYAEYLYKSTYEPPYNEDDVFTLNLNEGWNWISHPMERNIATSEINATAQRIVSQTMETVKDATLGWVGTLTSLAPNFAYKVQMEKDASFEFTGTFYDPALGLYLQKGWNWVGYPLNRAQNLSTALADFTPSEGDVIVARQGLATYEKGKWNGSLEILEPGQGYLYKSSESKSLMFTPVKTKEAKASPRFHAQPRTPWTAIDAPYPDVMGMVANIVHNGIEGNDGEYCLGAFSEDGECRGIGKYIDGTIFINIFGKNDEQIYLKAAEASTGIIYNVKEPFNFISDVKGSRVHPISLHLDAATDITALKQNSTIESVTYYSLNGMQVSNTKSQLAKGIYIMKCTLSNGTTMYKKIIIK